MVSEDSQTIHLYCHQFMVTHDYTYIHHGEEFNDVKLQSI